ncbi:MAG: hypothetical protein AB7Q29_00345 [Vicinamibacterales bacterium]
MRRSQQRGRAALLCVLVLASVTLRSAGAKAEPVDVGTVMWRLGEFVTAYYARAQSIICDELVRLQSLGPDLTTDMTPARRLLYELRVAWEPAPEGGTPDAQVLRTLVSVNNRPPRAKDRDGCMDPRSESTEPLSVFLPGNQDDYVFTAAGRGRVDGRQAVMIDYRARTRGPIEATRNDDCFSVELPGRSRGRVWVDEQNGEVLRLDEHLNGIFDVRVPPDPKRRDGSSSVVVERLDSSIRYRRITFSDPDETIVLPISKETLTVVRNAGIPRLRTSQTFRNYRRFMTGGRIVQ